MTADVPLAPVYGALAAAGLAGSLHCIGMCGPILAAFSQVFARDEPAEGRGRRLLRDFALYHAGRLWTYAFLGAAAGLAGDALRAGGALAGFQRGTALAFGAAVILAGAALSGIVPAPRLPAALGGCGLGRPRGRGALAALLCARAGVARLLLGALMGLLPCGLVYAALVLAATLPSPAHAALGMLAFGAGTLPSLSAVLLGGRAAPRWLRRHGARLVGLALIVAGGVACLRALALAPDAGCLDAGGRPAVRDGR